MPRPKLGQHFLVRGSVLERISVAACGPREDLVVEIGPGRGALTAKLLTRAARVIAIEIDPYLVNHLRSRYTGDHRLEVVHADVLETDLSQWGPAVIAGNLPYYITSPILEKVLALGDLAARAVLLMQKEVADRLTASPGSRDYGFLSVRAALAARARALFPVPPAAFRPPPQVDSAVVLLEPEPVAARLGIVSPADFIEFVGRCFHQKRKTLRNNLAPFYGKSLVDAWPEAGLRAEQVPLEKFAQMYHRLVVS